MRKDICYCSRVVFRYKKPNVYLNFNQLANLNFKHSESTFCPGIVCLCNVLASPSDDTIIRTKIWSIIL